MTRIVVPLDGSERSEQALVPAERLARLLLAEVELVHVVNGGRGRTLEERTAEAKHYLETIADRVPADVTARGLVVEGGDAASDIVRLAGNDADTLIIMSTRGLGAIGALVFGSVANTVVRETEVPVVLVHGEQPAPSGPIQRMLVPLDGSWFAEQAIPLATDLARRSDALISLVQAIDYPSSNPSGDVGLGPGVVYNDLEQTRNRARSYLDTLAGRLRRGDVRTTWEVRVGPAASEIARSAETTGTDLIVMSTHGRSGVRRLAFGSVMLDVVKSGAAPVLVVPQSTASSLDPLRPEHVPSSRG